MALRPGATAIIRGVQESLRTHVLPELRDRYAITELHYALMLLDRLAAEWDGAARLLVEENAILRDFLAGAARDLDGVDATLAAELRRAAGESEPDIRISTLAEFNDRLRGLQARALAAVMARGDGELTPQQARALRDGVARRTAGTP